jgi:cytochrome P450
LTDYFQRLLAQRRKSLRADNLISAFIQADADGERVNNEEILSTVMLLLLAGNETTTNLIANFVRLLDNFPEQDESLRSNPDMIKGATELTLRMLNSIRNIDRYARRDVNIDGTTYTKGRTRSCLAIVSKS